MTFQAPPPEAPRGNSMSADFYLTWHAQGSAAHQIPPMEFSKRGNQQQVICPEMKTGVVWDIDNIETGWLSWPKGGNKEYLPNPSISQPLPYPGSGFSENIKIPVALDQNTTGIWDQASTGSWKGFCQIAAVIAQQSAQNPGMLPVVACTGSTMVSTGQNSTQVPDFQIMQWVPRPQCLMPQDTPAQAPAPAPMAPQPQAAPAAPAPAAPMPQAAPAPAAPPAPQAAPQPQGDWGQPAPAGAWN